MHHCCKYIRDFLAVSIAAGTLASDLAAEASRVSLELQGRIVPKCGLTGAAGQWDFGSLGKAGARQERALAFTVNCNAPFTYGMSSTSGELRHQSAGADGSAGGLPYHVLVVIPTDDGGALRKSCDSAQLAGAQGQAAGCEADSGETTSMGKASALTVSWIPIGGPMREGQYSDDLRISVAAKY
jgi:hypothetical protein